MNSNILLSKIVATPGETSWSQAYSTLNLYIVISVKSESAEGKIVTEGKELFERLQREYFSLDIKNLKNIKESVEAAIADSLADKDISVVLASVTGDVLYIVTAGLGTAVLKRDSKVGIVASGEEGKVVAFSGNLAPDDIVVLETDDFAQKIPIAKLSKAIDSLEISEISENLAPLIHEASNGSEAAIILQYKNVTDTTEHEELTEEGTEKTAETEPANEPEVLEEKSLEENPNFPKIGLPKSLLSMSRKKIIVIAIILLIILFAGSIYFEKSRQEQAKLNAALSQVTTPAQKKYDEAVSLASLNKGLALDEFNDLKTTLEDARSKFKEGTSQRKKLDEFIGKVEGKIGELGNGSTVAGQKVIFDASPAGLVNFKEKGLFVVNSDNGTVTTLSTDGEKGKEFKSGNKNVVATAEDENNIYLAGDSGITKTDRKTGKSQVIIKDVITKSLDNFGSNIYTVEANIINKYQSPSYNAKAYLADGLKLSSPSSLAIDASIWVLDGGKVRKFTKGTEDSFTVSGLSKEISSDSLIFTSPDFSNLYILDKKTARIISITKEAGEVSNQYIWGSLSRASSFAVDESDKKVFVTIDGKLYSFDL